MGKIVVKTRKQLIGYQKEEKYITGLTRYTTISTDDLLEYASADSGVTKAQLIGSIYAFFKQVEQMLLNGHTIQMGDLGYLYLGAKTKASDTEKEAGVNSICNLLVRFRQSAKLRALVASKVRLTTLDSAENTNGSTGSDGSTGGGSTDGAGTGSGNDGSDDSGNSSGDDISGGY